MPRYTFNLAPLEYIHTTYGASTVSDPDQRAAQTRLLELAAEVLNQNPVPMDVAVTPRANIEINWESARATFGVDTAVELSTNVGLTPTGVGDTTHDNGFSKWIKKLESS